MLKQVILVRTDLKMDKGKLASQVAHASVDAVLKSGKIKVYLWRKQGMKKIVLKVKHLKEMLKYKQDAEKQGLKTSLIKDAGKTVFKKPTITTLAIGPDKDEKIDRVTKHLKVL